MKSKYQCFDPHAEIQCGSPDVLGSTFDGHGVNFALFSAHAQAVDVCLFDGDGSRQTRCLRLPSVTNEIWHGYVPGLRPGTLYGYRVHGPYDPLRGHRFNPAKLLLDPWARAISGRLEWSDTLYGWRLGGPEDDLKPDNRDDARQMLRSRVVAPTGARQVARPCIPWSRTVIYEAHVRGLTRLHPEVPPSLRGTFAGLATDPVLDHLQRLGVTAVELLPVQSFIDEPHLVARGLTNYWGYNSLNFFVPHGPYLASDDHDEVKFAIDKLHDRGIEVILDVVYNHTGEGNQFGPTLVYKGIDNLSYYNLDSSAPRQYMNFTGCGNTLNLAHPQVLRLVMASLRWWAEHFGVDGFRFDLATALTRTSQGVDFGASFLSVCAQDPVLQRLKLIAEPWDVGPYGYQLGSFPPGWAEWNDQFRNSARRFWLVDSGSATDLVGRMQGSPDIFARRWRCPSASINHIVAHDGFTLRDLVSWNEPQNLSNGENNQDGTRYNLSFNHGVEGPTADPAISSLRLRQCRNLLATLLLSRGTPMLLAGDELGQSQCGNNNPYCQDNPTTWLDWNAADQSDELIGFIARLIGLRQQIHGLCEDRFATRAGLSKLPSPVGTIMLPLDPDFLLLANATAQPVVFTLPAPGGGLPWAPVFSTETADGTVSAGGWLGDELCLSGLSLIVLTRLAAEASLNATPAPIDRV